MSAQLDSLVDRVLGVGQISDALDELGLPGNAGGGYRHFGSGRGTAVARAFTLRQVVAEPGTEAVVRHGEAALKLAMALRDLATSIPTKASVDRSMPRSPAAGIGSAHPSRPAPRA